MLDIRHRFPHSFPAVAKLTLRNFVVLGALYAGAGGPEAQAGDQVRLFLNQGANPSFPQFIDGVIQLPVARVKIMTGDCPQEGTSYSFEYESEDLEGSAPFLRVCDVTEVSVITCCVVLREALDEEIAARQQTDTDLQQQIDDGLALELDNPPENFFAGTQQVELQTGDGTIATSGNVEVTVTSVLLDAPVTVIIPVSAGDAPVVWVAKVAEALESDEQISEHFLVDNIGADFSLTTKLALANDATLNIAVANGSATGVTPSATSVNSVAGVAGVAGTPSTALGQFAFGPWGFAQSISVNPPVWQLLNNAEQIDYKIIHYDRLITDLTGGGGSNLDGIPTVNLAPGRIQTVVNLLGAQAFYILSVGTTAENAPLFVRPDDYDGVTNAKVWVMLQAESWNALSHAAFTIRNQNLTPSSGAVRADNLTEDRTNQLPDAPGTFAISGQADGSILSSDIGDASQGGNGAADNTLVAEYNGSGNLTSTSSTRTVSPNGSRTVLVNSANASASIGHGVGSSEDLIVFPPAPADRVVNYPTGNGTIALTTQTNGTIPTGVLVATATDDAAAAGALGQFVSATVAGDSPVALTTATGANVSSISLTAGDWDVEGIVTLIESSASVTIRQAGINLTSSTVPTDGTEVRDDRATTTTTQRVSLTPTRKRISLASTTTIYLTANVTFSAGTVEAYGHISARRVR